MFFLWIILKLGSVSLFVLSDLQYSKIGDVVEGKYFKIILSSLWCGSIFEVILSPKILVLKKFNG